VIALYSLALLVSAALLFLLEPMVGKFVLPLLGSAPEVWPATVLFFQAALLAGYGFAHVTSRLPARRQALLQLGLLAVAAVVLPIGVPDADPPDSGNPVPWLLLLLATTAGLPFLALAANGPMVQRWLASTRHRAAADPYFLFAASNGGSLLGLLAYPLVLERLLGLEDQGRAWSVAYGLSFALVAASAAALWLRPREEAGAATASADATPIVGAPPAPAAASGGAPASASAANRIDGRRRLLWLALAAVPSSLMLGATSYITRDLSPVPLLWVVPLALYLVTLVVAFSPWTDAERLTVWGRRLLPVAAILVAYTLVIGSQSPLGVLLVVHLAGLTVAGLMCHGRLAADRPSPRHLTEFYLWVALGGALGGAFNALVAPLVFPSLVEYPLALVAACLLRPAPPKKRPEVLEFFLRDERPTRWMDAIVPSLLGGAVALALVLARDDQGAVSQDVVGVVAGLALGFTVNMWRRPLRFALALGAIMLTAGLAASQGEELLERDRSFFGTYRVEVTGDDLHELVSGTTLHGSERVEPGPPEPLSYYHPKGPVGQAFEKLPRDVTSRVAAVGLGTGSLACYARPGDGFTFYEIDPVVVDIARDRELFTFLSDCPVRPRVVTGDGRRSLAESRPGSFGLVVVDAFNSDAIPLHLISREAVELYMSRTRGRGALLFHITNRYLDLEPVVANIARDLELTCRHQFHPALGPDYRHSEWALLARSRADLGRAGEDGRWRDCRRDPSKETWTDDYSNPLSVIDWG
jgi:hypothetical protein